MKSYCHRFDHVILLNIFLLQKTNIILQNINNALQKVD